MKNTTEKKNVQRKNLSNISNVYNKSLLTKQIYLPFTLVSKNIKEILEKMISNEIEGKCIVEGFIKPKSIKIISYSSGILFESNVMFDVVFQCLVCSPVEGMLIKCITKNMTQAGIRATLNEDPSPLIVYVSRDHHINNDYFNSIKEEDEITIRVIGQRYELNDSQVSVIGELVTPK